MISAASENATKSPVPSSVVAPIDRLEGGTIAAVSVVLFIAAGFAWWWLLVLFLVFDLSAIGYLAGNKTGAILYNLVHNYVIPAALVAVYVILLGAGIGAGPLAFIAGCWTFHVGLDRALGFGHRPQS